MDWGIWYDLAVLELSERNDPSKRELIEAAKKSLVEPAEDQEPVPTAEQPV
jgi:hypothetical protein